MSQPLLSESFSPSLSASAEQRGSARHAPYMNPSSVSTSGSVAAAAAMTTTTNNMPRSNGGDGAGSSSSSSAPRWSNGEERRSGGYVLPRSTSALTQLSRCSPMGKSVSMPVVARQHVLFSPRQSYAAATSSSSSASSASGNAKRNSTQLLESTADEDRRARRSSAESVSSVSSFGESSRLFEGGGGSSSNDAASSVSSFEQVSTVPSSHSQSITKAPKSATPPVAVQPAAPPEQASEKSAQDSQARDVAESNGRRCSSPSPPAVLHDCPSQQIPTIEQRDALAARVYGACRAAGYEEWLQLLDLAPLASQHHLSGYNCIKFGHEGSPYAYLPLSLQQPQQASELLEKQRSNETKALHWLAEKRRVAVRQRSASPGEAVRKLPRLDDTEMASGEQRQSRPCRCRKDANAEESTNSCSCGPLTNEAVLSSEWEAPLTDSGGASPWPSILAPAPQDPCLQTPFSASVKTSTSHPISISPIIPPEMLLDISTHVQNGIPRSLISSDAHLHPSSAHVPSPMVNLFDSQTTDEQHDQLQVDGERLIRCRVTRVDLSEVAYRAEQELIEATHSQRKPRTLTLIPPRVNHLPPHVLRDAIVSSTNDKSAWATLTDRRIYCETQCSPGEEEDACDAQPQSPSPSPYTIGNLFLSSCPGKKVRLTGPVRGRGAICRDLGLDLLRIRQLGVGAIVCCLDDEELAFLGAPWSQYEREADKLDIEVIRLPMAEGFSPTDVVATDKAISCIVNDYTLRGVHVLVHCRGGVGRAGLIACMWLLKLGLVRSDVDEFRSRVPVESLAGLHQPGDEEAEDRDGDRISGTLDTGHDVMQTIHRLIETIRRRRSPKAIETAEQVCFLVKYLNYLHRQERKHISRLAGKLSFNSHSSSAKIAA